jgi:hypothetical protein
VPKTVSTARLFRLKGHVWRNRLSAKVLQMGFERCRPLRFRVPVTAVVGSLAGGMTFEEVQREHDVTAEDIRAALGGNIEIRIHAPRRSSCGQIPVEAA